MTVHFNLAAVGTFQVTRHMTRAAAAAAAAVQAASLAAPDTLGQDAETAHGSQQDRVDVAAGPSKAADSDSEGPEPSSNGTGPESFVRHQDQQSAEGSEEVQGGQQGQADADCQAGPSAASSGQHTPEQQAASQNATGSMSQAPSWRRLEARMEGVLPIWSILKRFGRRAQTET